MSCSTHAGLSDCRPFAPAWSGTCGDLRREVRPAPVGPFSSRAHGVAHIPFAASVSVVPECLVSVW